MRWSLPKSMSLGAREVAVVALAFACGCSDDFCGGDIEPLVVGAGYRWVVGSTKDIVWWGGIGDISTVLIEYSTDGGESWQTIAEEADAAAERYSWTVAGPVSDSCVVRVTGDTGEWDDSPAFSTLWPGVYIDTPVEGDYLAVGRQYRITWLADGILQLGLASIGIDFWNGAEWVAVCGSTDVSAGTYRWTVDAGSASLPVTDASVRILGVPSEAFTVYSGFWYVDGDIVSGDGLTWATAFAHPQEACDLAQAGDEIWVAEGTYVLNHYMADAVLVMKEDVALYGGFAGGETNREDRGWRAHPTVLDGTDYKRGVIGASRARLDGFTIMRGYSSTDLGGGGGMLVPSSEFQIDNCVFLDNLCMGSGGGVYVVGSTVTIRDCVFAGNVARNGGGVFLYGWSTMATIENCVFSDNRADSFGGGVLDSDTSSAIANCVFSQNSATRGGGYYDTGYSTISNCIFWGNTDFGGDQLYVGEGGGSEVRFSDVQGGYEGTGNIDADPLFVDVSDLDGPDDIWGTADDGLRLQAGSPCIDAADGDAAPATDILGNPRVDDPTTTPDTGVGTPPWADMGAYEFQP